MPNVSRGTLILDKPAVIMTSNAKETSGFRVVSEDHQATVSYGNPVELPAGLYKVSFVRGACSCLLKDNWFSVEYI